MGTSVISPMIFYWISVLSDLKIGFAIGLGITLVISMVMMIFYLCEMFSYSPSETIMEKLLKLFKTSVKFLVFFVVMFIVIPTEDTMLKMLIADMVTYENIELTKESAMVIVDYIVEQVKAITG